MSLFKSAPRLADPLERGLEPLADLLQRGMATPEWQRLRETTVGDQVAAGVGSQAFVEETLAALPEEMKEQARTSGTGPTPGGTTPGRGRLAERLARGAARTLRGCERCRMTRPNRPPICKIRSPTCRQKRRRRKVRPRRRGRRFEAGLNQQAAQVASALNKAAAAAREQAEEASTFAAGFLPGGRR